MKFFPVCQIKDIDQYTIEHEPILSINLMERASLAFYQAFKEIYLNEEVHVFVGPGNNGGDALAIARLLLLDERDVSVWLLKPSGQLSPDAEINLHRLLSIEKAKVSELKDIDLKREISKGAVLIDGLFGSGLSRPLDSDALKVVKTLNELPNDLVAIDIPSGLFGEDNTDNNTKGIIQATHTISFQFPKLAFLMTENESFVGCWQIVDIGLNATSVEKTNSDWFYQCESEMQALLKKPNKFDHKGKFGHALLMSGSYGKMGAALLASKACLKSGVGLLTTHAPHVGYTILQTAVPEAMVSVDRSDYLISEFPDLAAYSAIGIGPGIGTKPNTQKMLEEFLLQVGDKPVVLDADALNILSEKRHLLERLPENSILTPHPGEFDRLAGVCSSGYERFEKAVAFATRYKIVLVLKGAHTLIVSPEGHCYFNSTGNAGMATAGSGDVLTGIILSLLAQGYQPVNAACLGVFIHGLAGDECYAEESFEGVTATGIIEALGSAFKQLRR